MSDWKSRATKVEPSTKDWKSRAGALSPPDQEESTMVGAGSRKFLNGATAGLSDEMSGINEAATRMVGGTNEKGDRFAPGEDPTDGSADPTLDWETLKHAYLRARDHRRDQLKQDSKDHPIVSTVADLAGSVVSPLNKLVKPLSAAKAGIVLGGVNAFGNSDADNGADLAKDTAIGSAIGGTVGKTVGAVANKFGPAIDDSVGSAANSAGEGLRDFAVDRSASAQGATKAIRNKLGPQQIAKIGAQGLDEGIVTPLASTADMIERNQSVMDKAMAARKGAYSAIDEVGASQFNPLKVATDVDTKLGATFNREGVLPSEISQGKQLQSMVDAVLQKGDKNISMLEAQKLVEALSKEAQFETSRSSAANNMAKAAYHAVRDAINQAAEDASGQVNIAGLRDVVENANKQYATGSLANKALTNKLASQSGNKLFGLTDTIASAPVAAEGVAALPKVGAMLAVKKGVERYGNQILATGSDKISKMLMQSPKMAALYENNPQAFQSIVAGIEKRVSPMAASNQQPQENQAQSKFQQQFSNDPSRIDMIQNEKLKEQLRKMQENKNPTQAVPAKEAQRQFIEGN